MILVLMLLPSRSRPQLSIVGRRGSRSRTEAIPGQQTPSNRNAGRLTRSFMPMRRVAFWIRRGGDSNPRSTLMDTAFPVLHNRPLCHLSGMV